MTKNIKLIFPCILLLVAGCSLAEKPNPLVENYCKSIDQKELQEYSKALAEIGSRPGNNVLKTDQTTKFIEETLGGFGYQLHSGKSDVSGDNKKPVNIIAEIPGIRYPNCVVELGAHYDTIPFCPGADDNGSGVVGVLAVARALAQAKCSKTIRLVFFCMEETGGGGSLTHVENILKNNNESFEGAIIFEMIGYSDDQPDTQRSPIRIPLILSPPTTGNFITVVGNGKSASIGNRYEHSIRKYEPDLNYYSLNRLGGFLSDGVRCDHASYWKSGLPAVMITDTADFRNPNYHESSDKIETLDFDFMAKVVRTSATTLLEWAELDSDSSKRNLNDNKNNLVFYKEICNQSAPKTPFENSIYGFSIKDLSREEACREIAMTYWNAVISGDNHLAKKLWYAWPAGGGCPHYQDENKPQEVVEIGDPYFQKGLNFNTPTMVVPTRVKFANGQEAHDKLIVTFHDLGLEESCLIVGTWNK